MALATADADGRPSLRMVLCKGFDARGFVFHTHYDSRKARELAANPVAALLFHWDPLGRQVRIEGTVEGRQRGIGPVLRDPATRRPDRGPRLGAEPAHRCRERSSTGGWPSSTARYEGRPVPRPESWGGFALRPESYEFWQNRDDRLHDRLRYTRAGDGWTIERLQP